MLGKIYSSSTCLIAASYGEGFGLPLIEAAHYEIPIIARNIPEFKEIAGTYAYYFDGLEPENLSITVEEWLKLFEKKQNPLSKDIPRQTWDESAGQLIKTSLGVGIDNQS